MRVRSGNRLRPPPFRQWSWCSIPGVDTVFWPYSSYIHFTTIAAAMLVVSGIDGILRSRSSAKRSSAKMRSTMDRALNVSFIIRHNNIIVVVVVVAVNLCYEHTWYLRHYRAEEEVYHHYTKSR